jgi:small subunit ribosomal protein S6
VEDQSMIYNEYELVYVARPELPADDLEKLSEKVQGLISGGEGGRVLVSEDWGRRKMAYQIQKHEHGHYVYINFVGGANLPLQVERKLRIDDKLLRYMTVRLGENIDPEERQVLAEERQQGRADRHAQELEAETARTEARAARAAAHAEADQHRQSRREERAVAERAEVGTGDEAATEGAPVEAAAESAPVEAAAETAPVEAVAETAPATDGSGTPETEEKTENTESGE